MHAKIILCFRKLVLGYRELGSSINLAGEWYAPRAQSKCLGLQLREG